jgi:hypothetical protein
MFLCDYRKLSAWNRNAEEREKGMAEDEWGREYCGYKLF